jgi:nitroreductase
MDYEQFLQFVKSRRSVRKFTNRRVTREQIERLIEAACWAPSNHNRQGWKFIVYENPATIQRMAIETRGLVSGSIAETGMLNVQAADELVCFAGGFEKAPVLILIMHKKSPAIGKPLLSRATGSLASGEALSAAMACQNLLLAVHSMGLGACVMTAPLLAGSMWNSIKDLPLGFEPTCLITVGYPDEIPPTPRRKKLEHVLEYR